MHWLGLRMGDTVRSWLRLITMKEHTVSKGKYKGGEDQGHQAGASLFPSLCSHTGCTGLLQASAGTMHVSCHTPSQLPGVCTDLASASGAQMPCSRIQQVGGNASLCRMVGPRKPFVSWGREGVQTSDKG
jgi:hypothetical protein